MKQRSRPEIGCHLIWEDHREKTLDRYSEAFKMQVVREVEQEGLACNHVQRKYGVRGAATVPSWVRKYGNGSWAKGYEWKHLKRSFIRSS